MSLKNFHINNFVSFKQSINNCPEFKGVIDRNNSNDIFKDDNNTLSYHFTVRDFKKVLSELTDIEKVVYINNFWNQKIYKSDIVNYKEKDYWATPYEFIKNGGDCEDYCIAKYYSLKESGISIEDMRIVVYFNEKLNSGHAVLVVSIDDEIYVLDNLRSRIVPLSNYCFYTPRFAVNEKSKWVYVKSTKK